MTLRESSAAYVAGKLARHAIMSKNVEDWKISCVGCGMLAVMPVTGSCGHTRCARCTRRNDVCICGVENCTKDRQSNILLRDIIEKMHYRRPLPKCRVSSSMHFPDDTKFTVLPKSPGRVVKYTMRSRLPKKPHRGADTHDWTRNIPLRRMASLPEYRIQYARHLLYSGRYRDAMAHLAHVAASPFKVSIFARNLLVKVIEILSPNDPKRLIRSVYKSVRLELATAWIDNTTVECPVCLELLQRPVTTICGHTFCRICIKRTFEEKKFCPLCCYNLSDFNLAQTESTKMVSAMVGAITDNPGVDPDRLTPVFACAVALPDITCPLMIIEAGYRTAVSALLKMGMRRFGMLASLGDDTYTNFGTIVDIRDYVELENGNCILSTVGVSRFHIIDKRIVNGCPYARVQEHTDIVPTSEISIAELQKQAQQVKTKAQEWLASLDEALRLDIAHHFGPFPEMSLEGEWWTNPNGPCWLWWLIAVLPLRAEIQMLMLATQHLSKRMTAILRTLHVANFLLVRPN